MRFPAIRWYRLEQWPLRRPGKIWDGNLEPGTLKNGKVSRQINGNRRGCGVPGFPSSPASRAAVETAGRHHPRRAGWNETCQAPSRRCTLVEVFVNEKKRANSSFGHNDT